MPRKEQGRSHYNFGLPMMFIHNGLTYRKQFDGCYHCFFAHQKITPNNCIKIITQAEAEELIINSAYIDTVLYLNDSEHFYLKP